MTPILEETLLPPRMATMQTAGNWFGHRTLFKSGMITQLVNLTLIHAAIFCKAAVNGCTITDHICTIVCNSVPAEITLAAIAVRIDAYTVAHLYIGYRSANFCNHTRKFMSQNGRRCHFCSTLVALVNVHICTTDTARLYLNQDIFCSYFWHRRFFHSHVMLSIKYCTFHLKFLHLISFDLHLCVTADYKYILTDGTSKYKW